MDVGYRGPERPRRVLIVLSATHGVEGYCGSGIQIGCLEEGVFAALPSETGVLLVHALNPFGFAWESRTNEDLVDVCRNFVDFTRALPENEASAALAPLLVPEQWEGPVREAADGALGRYLADRGLVRATSDIAKGQYSHWNAPFYGGRAPAWANRNLLECVRAHMSPDVRQVACIDCHSGLGPSGYGSMLIMHAPQSGAARRASEWWGERATFVRADDSAVYDVTGDVLDGLEAALPEVEFTAGCLEFGTLPVQDMLEAVRADHWLRCHGDPRAPLSRQIARKVRDAFYPDDSRWKRQVTEQGIGVTRETLAGLANS